MEGFFYYRQWGIGDALVRDIKEGLASAILGGTWITIDKNVKVGKKFICQGKVCMTVSPDISGGLGYRRVGEQGYDRDDPIVVMQMFQLGERFNSFWPVQKK